MYEYQVGEETRRCFSVAHVVRLRTSTTNACLCFTLMTRLPDRKPWKRAAGEKDPSRGIILDLQEKYDWKMPATVMLHSKEMALSLDDSLQAQCLPVFGSDRPRWTYRKVPKVTKFRNFGRLLSWSRKPQGMTYQFCSEDMTKIQRTSLCNTFQLTSEMTYGFVVYFHRNHQQGIGIALCVQ